MKWNRLSTLALVAGLSFGLGACSDDDDNVVNPPAETGQVRVIHASPDAPAVDIYVEGDNTPIATNVAYGAATGFVTVPVGTYNVQLRQAGADSSTDPVYETGDVVVGADQVITAIAAGLLSSDDPADRFRVIGLFDSFATPGSGNAIVRVVHASPDAPTVDIDVGNDGTSEILDLQRFAATPEAGVDLPGGSPLSIGIVANSTVVTTLTTPPLSAGTEYYLIATGLVGQSDIAAADAFVILAVDEGGTAFIRQDGPDAGSAMIRAVHGSPDAPAVDVYAEGISVPLFTALAYGDASIYASVPAGSYNIQLRAHPSTAADDVVYETGTVEVAANQKITAVASGFLGSMDEADSFRILPLAEETGIGSGALVRVVHAGPDAPTVDIDVGDDGNVDVFGLQRFADTGASWLELPSGQALQIAVRVAGGERVTAFTTPALPDGDEMFVIATGALASPARAEDGFSLLAVFSNGTSAFIKQNPVVYALHGSPDAPPVDIYAGDTPLVENLAFGEVSAPIQVPPADFYVLDFYAAGSGPGSPVASFPTPELVAGGAYLAVAAGELAPEDTEEEFTLLAFEELFESTDLSRIRAVHASGDAPAVDIGTVDGGTGDIDLVLFQNVSFGQASDAIGLEAPLGDLTVGVAPTGDSAPVAAFDVTTEAGLQTFAVAAGALAPDGEEAPFRLILVIASANPWIGAEVLPNL